MIERNGPSPAGGFSLLEILVAFAVLSVSLTAILAIYSSAFQSSSTAERYAVATQLVESKLKEVSVTSALQEGVEGSAPTEQYVWRATSRALDWQGPSGSGEHPLKPYEITVSAFWAEAGSEQAVSISTVRLTSAQ